MNPTDFMSPRWRRRIYFTLSGASALMSAASAGFGGIQHTVPNWLVFGLSAIGSLSTITNAVAGSHVDTSEDAGGAPL